MVKEIDNTLAMSEGWSCHDSPRSVRHRQLVLTEPGMM